MLFIVATPIGHRADISQRALDVLRASDAILCEDTRHSAKLLEHYGIRNPRIAYHKFNEKESLEHILQMLREGKNLSLISDAGTPCINDPGSILVNACREQGIPISAIPGPCSLIQALVLSGFESKRFQFVGFLPKPAGKILKEMLAFPGTSIAFESPERLCDTLALIDPSREVAVAREMTKTFEECRRGQAQDLLAHFQTHPPKGEIVLLIRQGPVPDDTSPEELVSLLMEYLGMDMKEAIKQAAKMKGISKREIYKIVHK
ncbi:MAG: 16S rRNA (cytidine(1402)-2'-O)-methyltransferase [Verrucomicrobia bacterium]|nr:16S rRNA (cytidine(1402)-2'-O)-methyltransferase [Verrucomicrobiota bacterium]MBU6446506.1 16S rRNA (cytidine(1402)-2'-O)-methyltransferase [Verrucomicrobiota bacterium]MDE3047989.1 16S rRNA (cytidine(1402)-2'-O)-methyltransferase [Verrucomicrobiota bacterium]